VKPPTWRNYSPLSDSILALYGVHARKTLYMSISVVPTRRLPLNRENHGLLFCSPLCQSTINAHLKHFYLMFVLEYEINCIHIRNELDP
jgi:hypothetical protein